MKDGHHERLLGKSNEQVVLCCDSLYPIAPWIFGIREATPDEDSRGIDAVVETEYGNVPIQVKSSNKFVKEHLKDHPDIPVIVVMAGDSERRIRRKLRTIVEQKLIATGVESQWLKGPDA